MICVNAVDKGDRRRFGVKAVDKGVRGEWREREKRVRETKLKRASGLVQKRKGLDAGRVAGGNFTGYDRAR